MRDCIYSLSWKAVSIQIANFSGQKLNESASIGQPKIVALGQHRAAEGDEFYQFCVIAERS